MKLKSAFEPVRSKKVVFLSSTGRAFALVEAIENERHSAPKEDQTLLKEGKSRDGKITVKRVGIYNAK